MKTFKSDISHITYPESERVSGRSIRESVLKVIQKEYPDFTEDKNISRSELTQFRKKYISQSVTRQVGDITKLEKTVIDSLTDQTTISDKIDDDITPPTFGQHVADKVAQFGGSWKFIILFISFLLLWIIINAFILLNRSFDPYPFIFLNLMLSCLAALQAPVIMMSQNRQGDKDREQSKKDYMVNLKSELEIRSLHEKIDHLIIHQQQELMEVQNVQIEMLNDILDQIEKK